MSTARILVVDDNPTNLKLVSDVLAFEGHEILQAADAEAALELIQRARPELILMDIALPGMDGLALTRRLKTDPATRGIAIVALTAFAMKGDDQRAFAAGCDGYITKPIDTRKLPDLVQHHLAATRRATSGASDASDGAGGGEGELRVLVIEDHPRQLKLARVVLSAAGNQVACAASAAEAFVIIKQDRPQVILLDLLLPGMDGLELVRHLKADAATRHIPVVAVTAFPEKYSRAVALAAGCDAYLVKPVSTRLLPQHLSAMLGRGAPGPEGGS